MKTFFKLLLAACCAAAVSCTDMLDTIQHFLDEGEQVYAGKIDSLKIRSGRNRVLVDGLLMYGMDTEKCVITWKPGDGQLEIPIVRNEPVEVFQYSIPLDEGSYDFEVVTYDKAGRASLKQTFSARSYGAQYENSFRTRTASSAVQDKFYVTVNLGPVILEASLNELEYEDSSGETVILELVPTTTELIIEDWLSEGRYRLATLYIPEVGAADTFRVYDTPRFFPEFIEPDPEVDKTGFSALYLPGDLDLTAWGGSLTKAFDGVINNDNFAHSWEPYFVDAAWFTLDMGTTVQLDRFKWNGITTDARLYNEGSVKRWEIWGMDTEPPADGSWDGWEKLLECESYKPSGQPVGTNSDEDRAYAAEGEMFTFPDEIPEVRYIRIKILETWAGANFIAFTELTFYEKL